jgi:tungstate transport system ATP-binding protein
MGDRQMTMAETGGGKLKDAAQRPPVLTVSNLELSHCDGFFLRIDHLCIEAGKIYVLTGPNGAGKSTLLQALGLLIEPKGGEIRIAGEQVLRQRSTLQRLRHRVTLVHQNPYLLDATVHHNLSVGLKIRGIGGYEQKRRIEEALSAVGLDGYAKRGARHLSGGEVRRVALARALALRTEILLLDEPTANLDRETISVFEELIRRLPAQGITVIMASHDPAQPRRLGAYVLHLLRGRLLPVHQGEKTLRQSEAVPLEILRCP